jgi:hypothetical protein
MAKLCGIDMKYNNRNERETYQDKCVERDWERDSKEKRAKRREFKEKERYGYED